MFEWFKNGLIARYYFKINWFVRKLSYSLFGTLVFHWPFKWAGFTMVKAAASAGLVMLALSFIKELIESYEASVVARVLGKSNTLWYHFKREGMKDLVPIFIGATAAFVILFMKANGL